MARAVCRTDRRSIPQPCSLLINGTPLTQRSDESRYCRYNRDMAQIPPTVSQRKEAVDTLSQEDRLWLAERLVEYRELLDFPRTS